MWYICASAQDEAYISGGFFGARRPAQRTVAPPLHPPKDGTHHLSWRCGRVPISFATSRIACVFRALACANVACRNIRTRCRCRMSSAAPAPRVDANRKMSERGRALQRELPRRRVRAVFSSAGVCRFADRLVATCRPEELSSAFAAYLAFGRPHSPIRDELTH
jgi:hypothetical protein